MPEQSVSHIDIEVRPSRGYQTVGYTARIVFPEPVPAVQAIAEADETYNLILEAVNQQLDALVEQKNQSEQASRTAHPTATHAAAAPAPAAGEQEWREGDKPNNAGKIRYLSSASFPSQLLREQAAKQLASLGLSSDDVDIFDDRVGNYGLESGNASYSAGKLKVKDGTKLAAAMQGKKIVGSVDFRHDGSINVTLSKDGKAALQAMEVAATLNAQLEASPV